MQPAPSGLGASWHPAGMRAKDSGPAFLGVGGRVPSEYQAQVLRQPIDSRFEGERIFGEGVGFGPEGPLSAIVFTASSRVGRARSARCPWGTSVARERESDATLGTSQTTSARRRQAEHSHLRMCPPARRKNKKGGRSACAFARVSSSIVGCNIGCWMGLRVLVAPPGVGGWAPQYNAQRLNDHVVLRVVCAQTGVSGIWSSRSVRS